jgi:putative transcriptional regulator
MESLPFARLEKGTLLIASPEIDRGLYFRSVLLLCEHSEHGSFGLIINKPFDMQLPEDLLHVTELGNPNIAIRTGGSVQPNQIILLHSSSGLGKESLEICPGVYLGGDVQFLQESLADQAGPQMRLIFGFSAWGPGELEREFLKGLWFLHPGSAQTVFELPPDKVWQQTLRDMGGKYATLSMIPEDLNLN